MPKLEPLEVLAFLVLVAESGIRLRTRKDVSALSHLDIRWPIEDTSWSYAATYPAGDLRPYRIIPETSTVRDQCQRFQRVGKLFSKDFLNRLDLLVDLRIVEFFVYRVDHHALHFLELLEGLPQDGPPRAWEKIH